MVWTAMLPAQQSSRACFLELAGEASIALVEGEGAFRVFAREKTVAHLTLAAHVVPRHSRGAYDDV